MANTKRYKMPDGEVNELGVDWNNIDDKPEAYPPSDHTHDDRYYTKTETDKKLSKYERHNLNIKMNGIDMAEFDGSRDIDVNITADIVGGITREEAYNIPKTKNKQSLTLTIDGKGPVEYDGSQEKQFNIPGFKTVETTLSKLEWQGDTAPFTYNLGEEYKDKACFIDFNSSEGTLEQYNAARNGKMAGGNGSTLYAWGAKPMIDIPVTITYLG